MLEAAYILPLLLVMLLVLLDVVIFATDRLQANDVMADTYNLVMGEATALSADPTKTFKHVQCNSNKVELNAAELESTVKGSFVKVFNGLQESDVILNTQAEADVTPQVYLVDVKFWSQTLFLPDAVAQSFPVKAKLILSFDLGC